MLDWWTKDINLIRLDFEGKLFSLSFLSLETLKMVHDKKNSSHTAGWRVIGWHSTGNEEVEIQAQRFIYS